MVSVTWLSGLHHVLFLPFLPTYQSSSMYWLLFSYLYGSPPLMHTPRCTYITSYVSYAKVYSYLAVELRHLSPKYHAAITSNLHGKERQIPLERQFSNYQ
jgi:hypothetical protein